MLRRLRVLRLSASAVVNRPPFLPRASSAARSPARWWIRTAWCAGATVTVTEQNTGFTPHRRHRGNRRVLGAEPRARRLHGGRRDVRVRRSSSRSRAHRRIGAHPRAQDAGRRPAGGGHGHRRGAAGGDDEQADRRQPLEPARSRSSLELPQLHRPDAARSRHDAQPRRLDVRRRPGGRQRHAVAAERLPDRRHVQQRRPAGRQPGHAGPRRARQHRGIPGAVEPVQRRIRRRRGRDHQHGHARRDQQLQRPRLHLFPRRPVQLARPLPAGGAPKPEERTLQAGFGVGGPIVKNRAHFYFTIEKDNEDIAGQKRFPAAAAPLATDIVGAFRCGPPTTSAAATCR